MKTPDYEALAYMFVHAAEALFSMAAAKSTEQKAANPAKPTEPKPKRAYGRPRGSKNWTGNETDVLRYMVEDNHSIDDIASALGRSAHSVEIKISKMKQNGLI